MIQVRKSQDRGHFDFGWLDTRHTFSFGDYFDPRHMGFSHLRVLNEDKVKGGGGFPTHAHRDMEIVTYVLGGALEHKDSLGTGSVIRPGDVQRMSAGTGITHSEFNASPKDPVHFLQIWIVPDRRGLTPSYEQKTFSREEKLGVLRLIASHDGRAGSVLVHQDVDVYASLLDAGQSIPFAAAQGHKVWVQVARGDINVGGTKLQAGDGAAITDVDSLEFKAETTSEFLLFVM